MTRLPVLLVSGAMVASASAAAADAVAAAAVAASVAAAVAAAELLPHAARPTAMHAVRTVVKNLFMIFPPL